MTRQRYRERGHLVNGLVWGVQQPEFIRTYEIITDTLSPGPPYTQNNSLSLRKDSILKVGRFDWTISGKYKAMERILAPAWGFGTLIGSHDPDWGLAFTKYLASINPNKPAIDVPLFLWELKDLPRMIRDLGRVLQRKVKPADVPGGHLAVQFGWAPLIGDLVKLLDLQKQMENRLRTIRSLEKREKNHRTITKSVVTDSFSRLIASGFSVPATSKYELLQKGGGVPVFIDGVPDTFGKMPSNNLGLLLGSNVSASTIWNAVPWSWLLDYFSNVGTFLASRRGGFELQFAEFVLTSQRTYTETGESADTGSRKFSGYSYQSIEKLRTVMVDPKPGIHFEEFLTGHQKGILLALFSANLLRKLGS